MKAIINLTQHATSIDQLAVGVIDFPDRTALTAALTVNNLPTAAGVLLRADKIVDLLRQHFPDHTAVGSVMIGGAPWLMAPLVNRLRDAGYTPVFAYSKRVSVDVLMDDGTCQKNTVFKHDGFVPAVY